MFCPGCGFKLEDGDIFCPECGLKIEPLPDNSSENDSQFGEYYGNDTDPNTYQPAPDNGTGYTPDTADYGTGVPQAPSGGYVNTPKKKNKTLPIILAVVAVIAVAAGVVLFFLFGKTSGREIDLNNYVTVSYEGYNGYGSATASFDYERFVAENADYIRINKKNADVDYIPDEIIPAEYLCNEFILFDLPFTSNLSDGDIITVEWTVSEEIDFIFKINGALKYDSKEFTVEGLVAVDSFDAFEYVSLNLNGTAPYGYVEYSVDSENDFVNYLTYSLDKSEGLSNGDVVTLTVNPRIDVAEYIERFGKLPAVAEKTYKISGLPEYTKSASGISASSMNEIKSHSENAVYKHLNRNNGSTEHLQSVRYVGNYFQSAKDGAYTDYENILTMVYEVYIYVDSANGAYYITYYHVIRYTDISVNSDGVCSVNLSAYTETKDRYYPAVLRNNYYYYGYDSILSLYAALVEPQLQYYTYEDNIIR